MHAVITEYDSARETAERGVAFSMLKDAAANERAERLQLQVGADDARYGPNGTGLLWSSAYNRHCRADGAM